MKRSNNQDGDDAIKARERAFRATTNLSAIAREMQNSANREPDNSSHAISTESLQTNTHTSVVPNRSKIPMDSPRKALMEAGSSSVSNPPPSSRANDDAMKARERQFRTTKVSNTSLPGSTLVSHQAEPTNSSDTRIAEDERVKARLRQFRTTNRVDVSSRLSSTIPENSEPQPLDPVTDSPGVWKPSVPVSAALAGDTSCPPVASSDFSSAPGSSLPPSSYSETALVPGSAANITSTHVSEEARLKARENQFRSAIVPNLSHFVESTSTVGPVGQEDTQTVVSESPSVWSGTSADHSRQTSTGTGASDSRIKARMRQFRSTTPSDNSRPIASSSGGVLGTLQSIESTITNKKSTNNHAAHTSGVGAYSVEMQGDTAIVNHRELSVVSTSAKNDLGIKGKRSIRSPKQKTSKRRHPTNAENRATVETGSDGSEEVPEEGEDTNLSDAENLAEKGAMRISNGGVAVPVYRGRLTAHPQDIALEPLARRNTREAEGPEAPHTVSEENRNGNQKEVVSDAASPWYKSWIFVAVCALIIVVAGVVGAVLAMSGGDGGGSPSAVTNSPTPPPTEFPLDLERMSAAKSHILDSISSGAVLDDTSSPQHSALLWIATDDDLSRITAESSIDEIHQMRVRYILACMYYSLNGDSWHSKLGWLDGSDDHCNWEYITCDTTTGAVTEIDSGGAVNMQGSIPSEALHLTSLGESEYLESPNFLAVPCLSVPYFVFFCFRPNCS